MSEDPNLEHGFLDLQPGEQPKSTFMGGLRLSARRRLYFLSGLLVLAIFAGLYGYAENRIFAGLNDWSQSERLAGLIARMENGIANARVEEKAFLLKKDPAMAETFDLQLKSVSESLSRLSRMPGMADHRKHISTIRDGLAQYDQQFAKLVDQERALGLTDGTGLSLDLQNATEDLQAKFSTAGYANLAGQISRINQEGKETLLSGYKKGVGEIQKRYQTLAIFLKETKIPAKRKESLQNLLKQHETYLLAMINSRFNFVEETQRFDDLVAYLAPSLSALSSFATSRRGAAAADLEAMRKFSRSVVGLGGGGAVVALLLIGLIIIRSMTRPIYDLAAVASRLADGDRTVSIPARGNSCSIGAVARALDYWLQNLSDMENLRRELDETRSRLESALSEVEDQDRAATAAARAALLSDESDEAPAPLPAGPIPDPTPAETDISGGGPISSVSRQLASFSQYVTAAADDVERTEALIRGLDDATRQIDDMSALVMAIRDQTNLLAFRSGPKDSGPDNLVILSGEDKEPTGDSRFPDADMAKRFDAIRDATERAERTTGAVRNTMTDVTKMAQDIAATASAQALEATTKLLTQSEYLQHMLDDVISKVSTDTPEKKSRDGEKGSAGKAAGDDKETPPKKA